MMPWTLYCGTHVYMHTNAVTAFQLGSSYTLDPKRFLYIMPSRGASTWSRPGLLSYMREYQLHPNCVRKSKLGQMCRSEQHDEVCLKCSWFETSTSNAICLWWRNVWASLIPNQFLPFNKRNLFQYNCSEQYSTTIDQKFTIPKLALPADTWSGAMTELRNTDVFQILRNSKILL